MPPTTARQPRTFAQAIDEALKDWKRVRKIGFRYNAATGRAWITDGLGREIPPAPTMFNQVEATWAEIGEQAARLVRRKYKVTIRVTC